MKYLLISLLFINLTCCNKNIITRENKSNSALSVKIYLIKDYKVRHKGQGYYETVNDSVYQKRFDIGISITNNSKSPITFWTMTCDWWWNFIINNKYIYFDNPGCDSNFPYPFTIKPNDSICYKKTLNRDLSFDNQCVNCIGVLPEYKVETTRLGFILIDSTQITSGHGYNYVMGDKYLWHEIIWSNPLYLNKK
jgi:hypothetical protein